MGAGYIHNKLSLGSLSRDSFDAYGLGVAIDYYVMFATGISIKNIYSFIGYSEVTGEKFEADANAIDYGLLLILPITKLFNNHTIELSNNSRLVPEFNYSLGYSRLNIGNEIYYTDPAQGDPLPLTGRLGHTMSLGFNYESEDISVNMVSYNFIIEADNILIERKEIGFSYQGMLGDIDLGKNLIQLKPDDNVVIHRGHALKLVETITLLSGSFTGRHLVNVSTDGFIIGSGGLFKWLSSVTENNMLKYFADHFEIKYINTTISYDSNLENDFSSLSVSLMNYFF